MVNTYKKILNVKILLNKQIDPLMNIKKDSRNHFNKKKISSKLDRLEKNKNCSKYKQQRSNK